MNIKEGHAPPFIYPVLTVILRIRNRKPSLLAHLISGNIGNILGGIDLFPKQHQKRAV